MTGEHVTEDFDVGDALDRLGDEGDDDTTTDTDVGEPETTALDERPALDEDETATVSFADKDEIESIVESVWPAPSFRKYQKAAIVEIVADLYIEDKDVVTLSAPTGAGKSLIIYTVSKVISAKQNARSFVTTPLNTLIDQIDNDEFIQDVTTIKGKNNYECVHHLDSGTAVDDAICQRQDDFDCEHKDAFDTNGGCPYYGRRNRAKQTDIAVTNLSYLMANSMIPKMEDARLGKRSLLAVDETQNIEDFALNFIGFTIDKREIPVNFKHLSSMPDEDCEMGEMVDWLREVLSQIIDRLMALNRKPRLSKQENDDEEQLERLKHRISNFLQDYDDGRHWTKTRDGTTVKFEPILIDRFTDSFLWEQADKVLLSSATIPKGDFLDEVGLGDANVGHISVPSTFPTTNRPVITDQMAGNMKRGERADTIPKMADKIEEIAAFHDGERGFIHCHSYDIMEALYSALPKYVRHKTMRQDKNDRMGSLKAWFNSDEQIFMSVSMDEGISLDDEKARWQVVAKASYPFVGDERVSYRLDEMDDWEWYNNQAIIDLQQAVGRGMRSKDDWCVTYLLDEGFESLLDYNEYLFEDWFLDSVDCQTHLDVYGAESGDTDFTFSA